MNDTCEGITSPTSPN